MGGRLNFTRIVKQTEAQTNIQMQFYTVEIVEAATCPVSAIASTLEILL